MLTPVLGCLPLKALSSAQHAACIKAMLEQMGLCYNVWAATWRSSHQVVAFVCSYNLQL